MQATQNSFNPAIEKDPGYGQLLAILLRRRFWLLGVMIGAISVAAFYTMRQEATFISSMQLLVEPNYQGKKTFGKELENDFADTKVEVDSATQISLMQSSNLLRQAMKLLQTKYVDLSPDDPASVESFKKSVSVVQVVQNAGGKKAVETKIFQVAYIDNDSEKTQDVLKALQKVYLDYNLEQQKIRLTRGLSFVNEQLPQIKNKVSQAESSLEQFRRDQELIDPDFQAKSQTESWNRIQQEQQANQAQLQELRSRYANLQRQVALSPKEALLASRLSQSSRYQTLLGEFQKTELQLIQQRLRFSDRTDFVQQVIDQRQRQLDLLKTEMGQILGTESAGMNGDSVLSKGQLGGVDLALVGQLIDAQINLKSAEARAFSLAATERQIRNELKRFPKLLAQFGRLQPEVELSRDTLKQLLKAQQEIGLEIARGGFDWQIVEEPQLGAKTGPSTTRNLLLGAVAGLLLGGVAAFAREAADDAVRSSEDLKKQTNVPLLGMIPELSLHMGQEDEAPLINLPFRKAASLKPGINDVLQWRPFRESLDLLYQNIQLVTGEHPLRSLVVTSALAGEGKSTLILGLAISAARLHQRVLLIDADLRRPSLHKLLNLPNDQGLSTLLTSDAPIPRQLETQGSNLRSNISVITAGPTPTDPAKLLSSQRMRDVLATFEQSYDLVLLDAPPVLGMVDTMLAASCCDGVVMVGRIDRVTRTELTQAIAMLNKLNVIGVVANGATSQLRGDGHYQRKP